MIDENITRYELSSRYITKWKEAERTLPYYPTAKLEYDLAKAWFTKRNTEQCQNLNKAVMQLYEERCCGILSTETSEEFDYIKNLPNRKLRRLLWVQMIHDCVNDYDILSSRDGLFLNSIAADRRSISNDEFSEPTDDDQ